MKGHTTISLIIDLESTIGKGQGVRVRNATLRGNWPTDFDDALNKDLIAVSEILSDAEKKVIDSLPTNNFLSPTRDEVVVKANNMAPADAYNFLLEWVLPVAPKRDFRMDFRLIR